MFCGKAFFWASFLAYLWCNKSYTLPIVNFNQNCNNLWWNHKLIFLWEFPLQFTFYSVFKEMAIFQLIFKDTRTVIDLYFPLRYIWYTISLLQEKNENNCVMSSLFKSSWKCQIDCSVLAQQKTGLLFTLKRVRFICKAFTYKHWYHCLTHAFKFKMRSWTFLFHKIEYFKTHHL